MKKIGFIDYYISEWHANNYPELIAGACEKLGVNYEVAYAWAELDVSPKDGITTEQWCEKYGVERCETIAELCDKSDAIVILAPSDPQTHLGYAEEALRYGKPVCIDKTFANDYESAKRIFDIAEKYGTPFFSASALRYGEELETDFTCREVITMGGGTDIPEYIVHQAEMVVKKLGLGAERVRTEQFGTQTHIHISYPDSRTATMIYAPAMPFTVYMSEADKAKPVYKIVQSKFFVGLVDDMIRFFEERSLSFDSRETLEIMKIREGAIGGMEKLGEWLSLSDI